MISNQFDNRSDTYQDIHQGSPAMPQTAKAKVFMNGRSQAVRIPAEYRFNSTEVFVAKDPVTGNLILSEKQPDWDEIFAALDAAGFADDFLGDRQKDFPPEREDL
jgi:antitoxin VapB